MPEVLQLLIRGNRRQREIHDIYTMETDGWLFLRRFEDPRIITDGISPLRKWTYGGVAGLKAVIGKHYTVSLDYFEALKRIHKMCSLRDYGLQLSVGYRF